MAAGKFAIQKASKLKEYVFQFFFFCERLSYHSILHPRIVLLIEKIM
jgi:hypothetical protein